MASRSGAAALAAAIGLTSCTLPLAAAPITTIRVSQVDASGRPNGPIFYETVPLPAAVVPLYVAAGPAPASAAPFLNAAAGTQASLRLDLDVGEHVFTLYANQGTRTMTHASLSLVFGGQVGPARMAVFAPFWTTQTSQPIFTANTVVGGALAYDDGNRRYELTDFFFASGERYPGIDRVGEFGVGADGQRDAIGQFRLRVSAHTQPVPAPATLPLVLAAGLAAGWNSRRHRSRKSPSEAMSMAQCPP